MTKHPKKLSFVRLLLNRWQKIESAIAAEMQKRWPDRLQLTRLKKLRLAIKDQLYHRHQLRRLGTRRTI